MREIKFRLYSKENEIMYDWEDLLSFDSFKDHMEIGHIENASYSTLMQYTGLKDSNGVETAHKDIVEFEGTTYVIEWCEEDTGFFLAHLKYLDDLKNEEHLRGRCIRESEILGNVYEHPHLLPKEDE